MVSYNNTFSYPQNHHASNLSYPTSAHQAAAAAAAWFPPNYPHPHTAANQQFLNGMTNPSDHHHQHATHLNYQHQAAAAAAMYYNSHMFHATPTSHELYGARENFQNFSPSSTNLPHHLSHTTPSCTPSSTSSSLIPSTFPHSYYSHNSKNGSLQGNGQYYAPPHHLGIGGYGGSSSGVGSPLDETSSSADILTEGVPSPPNTTGSGGSGINSPNVPNASTSPHLTNTHSPIRASTPAINIENKKNDNKCENIDDNQNENTQTESKLKMRLQSNNDREYYDWMKKPSYTSQPKPGKTRTSDKYRVVYTDFQRLELEKEYHTSRYITIRRKTELAQCLQLSERQVKIWFQNRRAKERKQKSKSTDDNVSSPGNSTPINSGMSNHVADELANFLDYKPSIKLEDYPQNSFSSQFCSMGPPGPPSNMLNPFPVMPPPPPPPSTCGGHNPHFGIPTSGQNGMLPQSSATGTNPMQHPYSQMLHSMIDPIP